MRLLRLIEEGALISLLRNENIFDWKFRSFDTAFSAVRVQCGFSNLIITFNFIEQKVETDEQ